MWLVVAAPMDRREAIVHAVTTVWTAHWEGLSRRVQCIDLCLVIHAHEPRFIHPRVARTREIACKNTP